VKYLPVGLDVRDRICVVVGGGQVGARKVANLLRVGAAVTVVSPEVTKELSELAQAGRLRWLEKGFGPEDLEGAFLAIAATDDGELNARLVREAKAKGVLVCDASSASRSEMIFGALHQKGGITVAVFTDGEDPSLARRSRDRIAALSEEWDEG
jgi:siroheme synthase-like protein